MIDGINLMERPKELNGKTIRIESGCGTLHITINGTNKYPIFEVFTIGGKNGSCSSVFLDVMNILITRCLRLGDDPYEIIDDLKGLSCPKSDNCDKVSCPEGISKIMEKYLDDVNTKKEVYNLDNSFEECPECGERTFNPSADGCAICMSCGYSPCS